MGYGVIVVESKEMRLVEMDVLRLPSKLDNYQRLQLIHQKVQEIITGFRPHEFAIEAPFFGKNVQSTLALGEARGVALFVTAEHGLTVRGYAPATVKKAVVGHGRATKDQIGYLVRALLAMRR